MKKYSLVIAFVSLVTLCSAQDSFVPNPYAYGKKLVELLRLNDTIALKQALVPNRTQVYLEVKDDLNNPHIKETDKNACLKDTLNDCYSKFISILEKDVVKTLNEVNTVLLKEDILISTLKYEKIFFEVEKNNHAFFTELDRARVLMSSGNRLFMLKVSNVISVGNNWYGSEYWNFGEVNQQLEYLADSVNDNSIKSLSQTQDPIQQIDGYISLITQTLNTGDTATYTKMAKIKKADFDSLAQKVLAYEHLSEKQRMQFEKLNLSYANKEIKQALNKMHSESLKKLQKFRNVDSTHEYSFYLVGLEYEYILDKDIPVILLEDLDLVYKIGDSYYKLNIDDVAFVNGMWKMGRVKRVTQVDVYFDRISSTNQHNSKKTVILNEEGTLLEVPKE